MKLTIKKKLLAMTLISLLNSSFSGCGQIDHVDSIELIQFRVDPSIDSNELEDNIENVKITEVFEENSSEILEEPKEDELEFNIVSVPVIIANKRTEILSEIGGEKIGYLPVSKSLELIEHLDNGYYQVKYFDQIGYVDENDAYVSAIFDIKSDIEKVLYAKEDTSLIIPHFLSETGEDEEVKINMLECFEVYEETENYYLVQTSDYIGYIEKTKVEELTGTFIVVDISDQVLKLYENNEVVLECPVVTGNVSNDNSTTEGIFTIYNITYNRYLIGPNYKSWVDIMMKFYGNEGFHDCEYHTDENGWSHGWREAYEFGGDTYIFDGSHGCVNMKHDDVMELKLHVDNGTTTVIKP